MIAPATKLDYLGIVLFAFAVRFWASALMAAGEVGIWRKSDLAAASSSNSAIAFWLKWFCFMDGRSDLCSKTFKD